ncbi:gluconolactone oxidase [Hypoxylon fuscum]|nr:gluconolactone oxidase [Hypoxylon fuscum]
MEIDTKSHTAKFGAGWDLIDLIPRLRNDSLSVANLGTERVQNFVGAFTTGTHGTGQNFGNLATQVIGFRVVYANGTIAVVNGTENKDKLDAFRISLGSLGIITEVTIQAQPLTYLKRTTEVLNTTSNLTQMYTDIQKLYEKHDRMMVWGPHMTWNDTNSTWVIDPQMSVTYWENTTTYPNVNNCSSNYCTNGCGQCLRNYSCYDETSDAVSTPPAGVCNRFFYAEIEHFFPMENFVSAAVNYTEFQLSQNMTGYNNLNMIYELRFVKGDNTWMSPVNQYNIAGNTSNTSNIFAVMEIDWYMTYNNFDTLWYYQSLAEKFIPRFGRFYNARPHWGKMSWFGYDFAKFIYPKLDEFLKLRNDSDPNCQFVNRFLVDHFNITSCLGIWNGGK